MRNLSYEYEFDLYESEPVGGTHFHMNGLTRFDPEAKGNSEMAYSSESVQKVNRRTR